MSLLDHSVYTKLKETSRGDVTHANQYTSYTGNCDPHLVPEANSTTYSGYDAALYSAATMYVAQQSTGAAQQKTGWQGYKKGGAAGKNMRAKAPPKPQQLHYCDVCKIR